MARSEILSAPDSVYEWDMASRCAGSACLWAMELVEMSVYELEKGWADRLGRVSALIVSNRALDKVLALQRADKCSQSFALDTAY